MWLYPFTHANKKKYSRRTCSTKLEKTIKPDDKLFSKRYSRRKPVLVIRRIIDYKGRHERTVVDIRSQFVANALIEINKDVEDLDLNKTPPEVHSPFRFKSQFSSVLLILS